MIVIIIIIIIVNSNNNNNNVIIIIMFFFFIFFFSLASVGQFAVWVLKGIIGFSSISPGQEPPALGSIENSAQCLFYLFQNESVFVKNDKNCSKLF